MFGLCIDLCHFRILSGMFTHEQPLFSGHFRTLFHHISSVFTSKPDVTYRNEASSHWPSGSHQDEAAACESRDDFVEAGTIV